VQNAPREPGGERYCRFSACLPLRPLCATTTFLSVITGFDSSFTGRHGNAGCAGRLLQRSPNILLIPGTSSVAHLRQNLAAGELQLPPDALETLNTLMADRHRRKARHVLPGFARFKR
jgi:hypothetical protein